ncbi:MAG: magnesium transporter CorA family protein [Ilumatobacteraceae bacterium]
MLTTHQYGTLQWIDIVDPSDEDLRTAADGYGLSDHTFDEANRRASRPMLQRFVDHAYLVAFSGSLAEIDMYIGPAWIVTVRRHDPDGHEWDPNVAMVRFERRCGGAPDSGKLLLTILDELVDGYFDSTDQIEIRIEGIEERIFGDNAHIEKTIQQELFGIRRELLELRRVVMPMREVLAALLRLEVPWINGEAIAQCRDTYDKLLRVVDVVDDQRELIGNAVDAHLAVMSNQMNSAMKTLTAWGSIVFGATLIAGIYGMNFEHMPELEWQYGYPFALGLMAVLGLALYRLMRRRDWL